MMGEADVAGYTRSGTRWELMFAAGETFRLTADDLRDVIRLLEAHAGILHSDPPLPCAITGSRESQTDAAHATLIERGEPMRIDELLSAVRSKGVRVGGATDAKAKYNFSSALSRDPRFRCAHWKSARRWWLAGSDLPKVGN